MIFKVRNQHSYTEVFLSLSYVEHESDEMKTLLPQISNQPPHWDIRYNIYVAPCIWVDFESRMCVCLCVCACEKSTEF